MSEWVVSEGEKSLPHLSHLAKHILELLQNEVDLKEKTLVEGEYVGLIFDATPRQ